MFTFIRELGIPITRTSVTIELQKHPYSDSLLAMSDVLNYWKVPNISYRLSDDQLYKLPKPFIAHLNSNEFVLVHELNDEEVVVTNENWSKYSFAREEFKRRFDKVVLVAEKVALSGDKHYLESHRREIVESCRMPLIALVSILLIVVGLISFSDYVSSFNFRVAIITFIMTAGVITTSLLLLQSIDPNNQIIKKICNVEDDQSCEAVLSSSASQIIKGLSWSAVGFFYFVGSWLIVTFNTSSIKLMQVLLILNICSLPYTFYSIYYQLKIVKKWCVLCTTVQVILWLEFFSLSLYIKYPLPVLKFPEWSSMFICFTIPVLFWTFLKQFLINKKRLVALSMQVQGLKINKPLFHQMLNLEPAKELLDENVSLMIGNHNASNIITVVSNPFCQPCLRAHRLLEEWVEQQNNIKIQVIFVTSDNKDDYRTKVVNQLMGVKAAKGNQVAKEAFSEWTKIKSNYTAWTKQYEILPAYSNETEAFVFKQRKWCEMVGITSTPTLFLNGRRIPNHYQVEDMKYLII